MLYGQIKLSELNPLMDFVNKHQATIAGGLGGGALSGGAAYLSADKDKLKKGLIGAIPGALAGGYVGSRYDGSARHHPFITREELDTSNQAWKDGHTWDDATGQWNQGPEIKAYLGDTPERRPWLWEGPYGVK